MGMSEYERSFNEKGKVCYSDGVATIAPATTHLYLFETNGTKVVLTSILFVGRAADSKIAFYEAPTVTTPGTSLPVASYNRVVNRTPLASFSNSTVTVSANGTELGHITVFSPGGASTKSDVDSKSLTDDGVEFILAPNTQYLFAIDNLDATVTSDFNFKIKWIELND